MKKLESNPPPLPKPIKYTKYTSVNNKRVKIPLQNPLICKNTPSKVIKMDKLRPLNMLNY